LQLLFSSWPVPILEADNYSYSIGHPLFSAQIVVPSIRKLRFIDVHDGVVELWILNIIPLFVHAHYHHVVASIVEVFVRPWVSVWLKYLDQDNDGTAALDKAFQLLNTHVLFSVELQGILQVSFRTAH
jgi:hypothetical protein